MGVFSGIFATLRRWFAPEPHRLAYAPGLLGPAIEPLEGNKVRILEGGLTGQVFDLSTVLSEDEAHVFLHLDGKQVGHADIQRNAFEASIVLWNIVVQENLRNNGLASLMIRTGFRRMLELHKKPSFAIRMIRLIRPKDRVTKVQNIGIGIIARKLGFSPEYDLPALLVRDNIQVIEYLESDGVMPPGFRIVIKVFPLVLVAFVVDPFTGKPFSRVHPFYQQHVFPETVETWVGDGKIIIGNGNYLLRRNGIPNLINHIARDELEAQQLARRIRPARN
jgi:hypothetical protein